MADLIMPRKTPTRFTPDLRQKFLEILADTGRYAHAARDVGISAGHANSMRNPLHVSYDPDFASACEDAMELYRDKVDQEVARRGVEGWDEAVYGKDGYVGDVRKYSDRLLELHAKRHIREYGARLELSGQVGSGSTGRSQKLAPELARRLADLDVEGRRCLLVVLRQLDAADRHRESEAQAMEAAQALEQVAEAAGADPAPIGELEAGADVQDAEFEVEEQTPADRARMLAERRARKNGPRGVSDEEEQALRERMRRRHGTGEGEGA